MRVDGEKLRRLRERRALSLKDLAARAGIGWVTSWRRETGAVKAVRPSTARKIAEALDVALDDFMIWDDDRGKVAAA
jgi:transcriptional regulator with XRE-family HTH domain